MPLRKVAHGLSLCLPIFVASATRDAKISLDLTEIARVETPVKPVATAEEAPSAEEPAAVRLAWNKILERDHAFVTFSGRNGTIVVSSAAGNDIPYFEGKSGICRKLAGSRDSFFRLHALY